jgi:hypothetical protein
MKYPLTLRVGDFAPSSPSRDLTYDLQAVVVQSNDGEVASGTFASIVNNGKTWFWIKDHQVSPLSHHDIMQFSGECLNSNNRPYVSFYVTQILYVKRGSPAALNHFVEIPPRVVSDYFMMTRQMQPSKLKKLSKSKSGHQSMDCVNVQTISSNKLIKTKMLSDNIFEHVQQGSLRLALKESLKYV